MPMHKCTVSKALFESFYLIPHFKSLVGQGVQQVLQLVQSLSFKEEQHSCSEVYLSSCRVADSKVPTLTFIYSTAHY